MGPSLLCRRLNVSMIGLNQDKQKAISQKVEEKNKIMGQILHLTRKILWAGLKVNFLDGS